MNIDNTHTLLTILGTLLGGGVGIALFAKATKKYAKIEGVVLHVIITALSVGGAVLEYVYQLHSSLPPAILGVSVPALYGYSQLLYKYAGYAKNVAGQLQVVNVNNTEPAAVPVAASSVEANF